MTKKNSKKKVIIIISVLVIIIACALLYLKFFKYNNNNLSLEENKWLDSNKYDVVDVALINNLPIFSNNGEGVIYDYLSYVTSDTSLKFNIIPFKIGDTLDYEYKLDISDNYSKDDIVLLKDSFILVTNNNLEYNDINKIKNLKLGILDSDVSVFENYFINQNIEFIKYESYSNLKEQLSKEKQNIQDNIANTIDGILIPKIIFTEELIKDNYKISYIFDNLNKYVVLKMNGNSNLNNILKKKYNIWSLKNYKSSYNKSLLNNYFAYKNVSDLDIKKLQSKKYEYGFIDYGLYNYMNQKEINGLTSLILKDFNSFSNLTIKYTKYNSINAMIKDFKSNKVDFILNTINDSDSNFYKTVGTYNKKIAIISANSNKEIINNITDLKDKVVLNVKDNNLENYLTINKAKVKSYNNLNDLLTDFDSNDIAIIDLDNYDFYSSTLLKNAKINYIYNTDEQYNFLINNN
ncbi:MAG: hypothetical protein Q4E75_04170, partial [bacterium]|nr:hypothetical protein [bacterium]